MSDHVDLTKCGPECILELQEAVTEAEMRANDAQSKLITLESRIKELEHEVESWRVTEAVRSHPDYPRQLAAFTELMHQRPCAVCEAADHDATTHAALSPTQETDPRCPTCGGRWVGDPEGSGEPCLDPFHARPTQETDPE